MFPPSFYDKLDPTYRQQLDEVVNAASKMNNEHTKANEDNYFAVFTKFCSNFMTPKELWENYERFTFIKQTNYNFDCFYSDYLKAEEALQPFKKLFNQSSYHFFYNKSGKMYFLHKLMDKTIDVNTICPQNVTVEDFCYPHNMLIQFFNCYMKKAYAQLPKEKIQIFYKMKNLYPKIKSFEGGADVENWFKAVVEAEDFEFIQQNVEDKLGDDLTNKELWHLYIGYLKEHNVQHLLQIYSKYCRFFVDDTKIKEEYQKSAKKYGPVTVSWKNTFEFEIFADHQDKERKIIQDNQSTNHHRLPYCFTSDGIKSQFFPFHSNLMNYIIQNVNANVLQKLNHSCKYFYRKYRIPVCYNLTVSIRFLVLYTEYTQESAFIPRISIFKTHFSKIYISTVFNFSDNNIFSLSNIIPHIYRCDAKYICIRNQIITFNDFHFLVGHGNVEDLELDAVRIKTSDQTVMKLEDILLMTPKLRYLRMKDILYSFETAQKLCDLSFLHKLQHFEISSAENILLEPNALAEFVKMNIASNGYIKMEFIFEDNPVRMNEITGAIENVPIINWEENKRPIFKYAQRIFQFM